jgi:phospholysine phosphohistidine inorganic pyrophosphate phosphatase
MSGPGALLVDLDGTLYVGEEPLPGAVEAIARLQALGVPRRYLTNTTRFSRRDLGARLRGMGFPIAEEELFTAPVAAAAWLRARGIRRVMLCLPPSSHEDFPDFDLDHPRPGAVVVGDMGDAWSFARLDAAFRALMDGAALVALQKNRYWMTPGGLSLDAGPFVAALEFAARTTATVVGKPSAEFFALAVDGLGVEPSSITAIGDDIEADVGGAQRTGLRGALVRTGKFREEDLGGAVAPDEIGDSVRDLVERWYGGF